MVVYRRRLRALGGRELDHGLVGGLAPAGAPGVLDFAHLGQFHAHVFHVGLAQHEGLKHGVEDPNENDPSGDDGQHLKKHFLSQNLLFVHEIVDRSFLLRRLEIGEKRGRIRPFVTFAGHSRGTVLGVFTQRLVLGLTKRFEACSVFVP
jgi:hypothetical protein